MAIRYDQKKKDAVVAFVQKFNETNGRGGQTAAVEKFSINPITVRNWMDKAGLPAPKKKTKSIVQRAKKPSSTPLSSPVRALRRMSEIQEKIEALQLEYTQLKAAL